MEEGEKMLEEGEEVVRVLVVDDSLVDRKIVERLIKRSGQIFQVVTVDSGKKALEVLGLTDDEEKDLPIADEQHRIDIVLTDYCMPKMTGYDLLKALKENSCSRSIPVVLMSSENDAQRIARCMATGAEDFILKPLQTKEVDNLRLYAKPKKASLSATKPVETKPAENKRKLPLELLTESSGGSERKPCLAGVAVA